jgi:hypothetical protein
MEESISLEAGIFNADMNANFLSQEINALGLNEKCVNWYHLEGNMVETRKNINHHLQDHTDPNPVSV